MNRIVHFEIGTDDLSRAKKFYENVFGWKIEKWESPDAEMEYWMITMGEKDVPGIDGGLYKREKALMMSKNHQEATGFVNTVNVEDIDDTISKIIKSGGEIVEEKMEIPGIGILAYVADTEGNIFGVMQGKEM